MAGTNVSSLPDIDYFTGMPQFIGAAGDILLVPELPEGKIYQLKKEGGLWTVVAEHDTFDWLGYSRLHPEWVFRNGNDLLIMDASPVYQGFHVPKMTVVRNLDGFFTPQESLTLESKLQDPDIFGFSINSITPLPDLLVMQSQVDYVGIGGMLKGFTFMKTDSGWTLGPDLPMATGYCWPVHSEVKNGVLHLWSMRMTSAYGPPPHDFIFTEHTLSGNNWTTVREESFVMSTQVDILSGTRPILSEDGSSIVLFPHHLEFRRDASGWIYAGPVNNGQLDFTDLYLSAIGDGYALMRSGDVYFDPQGPAQHYHLLQFGNGEWQLVGDLPSHRRLGDYYYTEIFYSLTNETVTIFDISLYNRTAREYDRSSLQPIISKWFPDSQSVDAGIEWLPNLGYFHPLFSDDGRGNWMWHWDLGWIYVTGRNSSSFYYWSTATGWSYCSTEFYNEQDDRFWLYALRFGDYLWYHPNSINPRLFYSYKLHEWISDTIVPSLEDLTTEDLASISRIFEEDGIVVQMDFVNQVAHISFSDIIDGTAVTINIDAPWQYTTGNPYACSAHFEIDFSWINITANGQSVTVNTLDFWTQEKVLMPMTLYMDFIFHTYDSGIIFETTRYNNNTLEGPVRTLFPDGG